MIHTLCPHCKGQLQVDESFAGSAMKCPFCGGAFIAPSSVAVQQDEDSGDEFPTWAIWLCVIAGHFVLVLILALMSSPGFAITLVIFIAMAELAVWQRERLLKLFTDVRESETTKRVIQQAKDQVRESARAVRDGLASQSMPADDAPDEPPVIAEIVRDDDDVLVEIQTASAPACRPQTIVAQPKRQSRRSMWSSRDGQRLNAKLPTDSVYFYGPGAQLDLGRGVLEWPLVYASGASYKGTFDASLIDGTLKVAPPGTRVGEQLPYWPSYYDCSPAQRSRYLDWLLAGRSDPDVELGYVFIFLVRQQKLWVMYGGALGNRNNKACLCEESFA